MPRKIEDDSDNIPSDDESVGSNDDVMDKVEDADDSNSDNDSDDGNGEEKEEKKLTPKKRTPKAKKAPSDKSKGKSKDKSKDKSKSKSKSKSNKSKTDDTSSDDAEDIPDDGKTPLERRKERLDELKEYRKQIKDDEEHTLSASQFHEREREIDMKFLLECYQERATQNEQFIKDVSELFAKFNKDKKKEDSVINSVLKKQLKGFAKTIKEPSKKREVNHPLKTPSKALAKIIGKDDITQSDAISKFHQYITDKCEEHDIDKKDDSNYMEELRKVDKHLKALVPDKLIKELNKEKFAKVEKKGTTLSDSQKKKYDSNELITEHAMSIVARNLSKSD